MTVPLRMEDVKVGDLVKLEGTDGPFAVVVHTCSHGFQTEWLPDVTHDEIFEAMKASCFAATGGHSATWSPVFTKTFYAQLLETGSMLVLPGPYIDQ